MFYLFAGKPDSKFRTYDGKVCMSPDELDELNQRVHEKFRLHNIPQVVTNASVALDKNQSLQFGTWAEFQQFNWKIASSVKELTLRWDFLIKLESHVVPQRHTLTLKVSGPINPRSVLQIIFSSDDGEDVDLSSIGETCLARVDFISHALADELLALVGEWHAALPRATSADTFFGKLEAYDGWIASAIHVTVPSMLAAVALAALWRLASFHRLDAMLTVEIMRNFCAWLLASVVALTVSARMSKSLAQKAYQSVNMYGRHHPFKFTRGDDEVQTKIAKRDKHSVGMFWASSGFALFLNILAGVITWWMLPGS